MKYIQLLTASFILFIASFAFANDARVEAIIDSKKPPIGVVFEIVDFSTKNYLELALNRFDTYQKRLKKAHPDIKLAIVSHGREQFALSSSNKQKFSKTHSLVKRITAESDVPVHVCGNHASGYDLSEKDFPDYVDVAPSAGGALKSYEERGYEVIYLKL